MDILLIIISIVWAVYCLIGVVLMFCNKLKTFNTGAEAYADIFSNLWVLYSWPWQLKE